MNLQIAYLNSDDSSDLPEELGFRSEKWAQHIVDHPHTETYELSEFVANFNTETISDLGYTVLIDGTTKRLINW